MKAEVVRRVAARDPDAAATHATDIEEIGRRALDEVRQAVTGYRTTSLTAELDRARTACEAARVALDVTGDEGLPPDAATLLGWAVREGGTNVLRHADAGRCRVDVRRTGRGARLTVDDDGRGALRDTSPATDTGVGLRGLRERVVAAGGTLHAGSTPEGFRLTVEVPVPSAVGVS